MIDDLQSNGLELQQTLHELKTINKLLGGNHVTTNGITKLLKSKQKQKVSIADVGCGGGDMIRVMADWAQRKKILVEFTGIDANPYTIKMAENNLQDMTNVSLETANVFDKEFQSEKVDIITCTLFTHHFTDEELVLMFQSFREKARIGLVINDIHRNPLAYYGIKVLTHFFSKSRLVRNDAPISVLRSFNKAELTALLKKGGWEKFQITWKWAFRWQVIGMK